MTVGAIGRALQLYRRTADVRAIVALLAANAIPLVGVLFLDWSLLTILVIYWLENGIVGLWNVPRLLLAGGQVIPEAELERQARRLDALPRYVPIERETAQAALADAIGRGRRTMHPAARVGLAAFFVVHYGIFWTVHGTFVFLLPGFAGGVRGAGPVFDVDPGSGIPFPNPDPGLGAGSAFGEILWPSVILAGLALFLSHGLSFLLNYVGRGEYRDASPNGQMFAPYARVITLHVTIILGALGIAALGAPVVALVVLVGLKTAFDLALHLREHRSRAAAPA